MVQRPLGRRRDADRKQREPLGSALLAVLLALLGGDGVGQLALGHAGAAGDAQLPGPLQQLRLGVALDVHAAIGPLGPRPRGRRALPGLRVRRALAVLGLPSVATLLERVLQRGVRGAVGTVALTIGLHRSVVGLRPGALSLRRRALQRARKVLFPGDRHIQSPPRPVTTPPGGAQPAGDASARRAAAPGARACPARRRPGGTPAPPPSRARRAGAASTSAVRTGGRSGSPSSRAARTRGSRGRARRRTARRG